MTTPSDVTIGEVFRVVKEIREELHAMNGSVSQHAVELAVLRERQDQLRGEARGTASRWGGGVGAAIGAAIAGLMHYVTR